MPSQNELQLMMSSTPTRLETVFCADRSFFATLNGWSGRRATNSLAALASNLGFAHKVSYRSVRRISDVGKFETVHDSNALRIYGYRSTRQKTEPLDSCPIREGRETRPSRMQPFFRFGGRCLALERRREAASPWPPQRVAYEVARRAQRCRQLSFR
jgi:hypothetical protein